MPSVVSITNIGTTQVEVPDFFGSYGRGSGSESGNSYEQELESSGSGIIIGKNDTELLIVTNNHVVADSTTLSVAFSDASTADAKTKGTDADSDLAVIAVALEDIDSNTLSQIKVAELGDSEQLKVGEAAIAIGNALGYGQSVTTGVISAVEREVTVDNVTSSLLQTDAAINPGNSGGALLNMQGQVIGINSVKYSSTDVEGMGYAIPISTAIPIINELVTKETKDKVDSTETGYLGIAGVDVSEEAASTYNMPIGVYIAQVMEGSAAETAGLKKSDIITKFDGTSVASMESLQDILQYYAAGSTLVITVESAQDGEYAEKDITITLGRKVE
jgi:serine protease Do